MPVESLQSGCCCSKQDLKKEARRTNRFNTTTTTTTTTTSNNSRPSSLTSCNRIETNSRLSNDYKMQDNNDVPCINIILKPISDPKSEQKDKGIQIVEITAVKENSMKDNFNDGTISPSNFVKTKEESRPSSPRMNEKLDKKCVEIQTENGEYCRDISVQTETKNESTGENKIVQFRDDKTIKDNSDDRNLNLTKTLYGSTLNGDDKMKGISYLETCTNKVNERDGDSEKLSERINRKIDKLSVESKKSPISFSHSDTMSCNDTCKIIPTQAESVKTYSDEAEKSLGKSFPVTENTETLPSVLSNNSPIPRISIDTTEFESPAKNNSSKSTMTEKKIDEFKNGLEIGRNFFNYEDENFSEFSIDGNLTSETKSKNNHSDDVESIGANLISYKRETREYEDAVDTKSDISLPKPITSSALIASDLTRPEFIRMLTEIKEHTCNLKMQLSAMNETMKRKEANRTKTFGSSMKKEKENGKTIEDSIRSSCCGPSDEISLLQKSEDNENCCEEFVSTSPKSHKKLKPSSRINRSDKRDEVIVYRDESNISLRKNKTKNKPVFKTKRSYLRNQKLHGSISSAESLAAPRIISDLSVLKNKIDVSCSPTNCCSVYEMIDQSNAQPSFFNSTPKKVSSTNKLCGTVKESGSKSDDQDQTTELRSRLGVKQVPFENKTKDCRKIISSNSRISPSASRESFKESSPKESLKYSKTRENFANRFSSQLRKLSPIPRLNREPIDIKNSSDTFTSERLIEQDFSFSVNNSDKIDSEEEVHSMDYPGIKSVREYNCDELKNSGNGKKRARKSDCRESIKFNEKPGFNNSVASDSEKNHQSSQYQEQSENNSISETISESLDCREQCDHVSEKFSQSNSKREDSKCTIRVTVSLDEETPSNERTK